MGQLCLALAPKHLKITFFRPSSQTPLPTPDTLRHSNRLCLHSAYPAGDGSVAKRGISTWHNGLYCRDL